MSNNVLAIIEMERFPQEVANRAAWIAERYGCDLELVLSDPTIGFLRESFMISADSQQIADTVQQAQQEAIDDIANSIPTGNPKIATAIIHDRPAADAVVAYALDKDPVIVVKGTTYHSPAERATFTFNDWQLIRKLDYPLWLVKPHDVKDEPVVVAAVDPMHPHDDEAGMAQAVVDAGKDLVAKADATLLLLHTYERLDEVSSYAMFTFKPVKVPVEELERKMRDEHRRQLDSLAAKNKIDAEAIHMLPGRTREVLPAFAREQDADVVVMGAVARGGLKRRIIGSTAEHVLDHVPCDILVVRPG